MLSNIHIKKLLTLTKNIILLYIYNFRSKFKFLIWFPCSISVRDLLSLYIHLYTKRFPFEALFSCYFLLFISMVSLLFFFFFFFFFLPLTCWLISAHDCLNVAMPIYFSFFSFLHDILLNIYYFSYSGIRDFLEAN